MRASDFHVDEGGNGAGDLGGGSVGWGGTHAQSRV